MPDMNLTYEQIQSAASRLNAGQSNIDGELGSLQSLVQDLVTSGFVTDVASGAFEAAFEEFSNGAQQVIAGLSQMSNYLNAAVSTFQETDSQLANALQR